MLRTLSRPEWVEAVLADFEGFLADHAANERKASANAMSMVVHYPDKIVLVDTMVEIALEEMQHFRDVYQLMRSRGLSLQADVKDLYVNRLLKKARHDRQGRLLDRLVLGCVIEARGCERFGLISKAHAEADMQAFYKDLARSESRHREQFLEVAKSLFPADEVEACLDQWLDLEAKVLEDLPVRALLH